MPPKIHPSFFIPRNKTGRIYLKISEVFLSIEMIRFQFTFIFVHNSVFQIVYDKQVIWHTSYEKQWKEHCLGICCLSVVI